MQQAEKQIENVQAATEQMRSDLIRVRQDIEAATASEAASIEAAIREGKPPRTSSKVDALRRREADLMRHLEAAAPLEAKLKVEAARAALEQAEADQKAAGERVGAEQEKVNEAQERLADAQNRANWAMGDVHTRRDQLRLAMDRLEAADPEAAAAIRTAEQEEIGPVMTEEQIIAYRKQLAADAGLYVIEDEAEEQALRTAAVKRGSTLTVMGRRNTGG